MRHLKISLHYSDIVKHKNGTQFCLTVKHAKFSIEQLDCEPSFRTNNIHIASYHHFYYFLL